MLYSCPTGSSATITAINYTNTNQASERTISIFRRSQNTNVALYAPVLHLAVGGFAIDDTVYKLKAGDSIVGYASVADEVTYSISGYEEAAGVNNLDNS